MPKRKSDVQVSRQQMRLEFEALADDYFDYPQPVASYRLDGSYIEPKLSKAWVWYCFGRNHHMGNS